MLFIWGTRNRRVSVNAPETMPGGCATCQGDLVEMEWSKYFTVFFLPLFRIRKLQSVLHCSNCKTDYTKRTDTQWANPQQG